MELLSAVQTITKCESAEELKSLSEERKQNLAQALEMRVPSGLATIEEWNELLKLFADATPETDNDVAKDKLLCYLRGEVYEEKPVAVEEKPAPARKWKWWPFKRK